MWFLLLKLFCIFFFGGMTVILKIVGLTKLQVTQDFFRGYEIHKICDQQNYD